MIVQKSTYFVEFIFADELLFKNFTELIFADHPGVNYVEIIFADLMQGQNT